MALIASAQSALPSTWDETIVPALRKRLESESRILSKRMSSASIASVDDLPYPPLRGSSHTKASISAVQQYDANAMNGIRDTSDHPATAKQSNGHVQAAHTHRTDTEGSTNSSRRGRARTYSQPLGYDGPVRNGQGQPQANGLPSSESSRSTSPLQNYNGRTSDVKPTRIPVVVTRGRTSTSSYATGRSSDASRNGNGPPSGSQPRLHGVEVAPSNQSESTVTVSSSQILNEPAPFKYSVDMQPSIPLSSGSTDLEERPFEHWYRGDIHRNGGVGELRVGGKQEMLDIANYGHRFGGVGSKPVPPSVSRTPLTSRVRSEHASVRRKRAESIGTRESFYMDEDRARELSNVLNEDPLTDLEGDEDQDTMLNETDRDYYAANGFSGAATSSSSTSDMRSTTPTVHNDWSMERERIAPRTRIPEPRQNSAPLQTDNAPPTAPTRSGSEPPTLPASSSTSAGVRSQQTARSVSNPSSLDTAKRRANPPPTPSSSAKTPKKASKSPARKMADKDRRSVAVYPELQGDDIENAIPSWTQPKLAGGNWDEVVLPVVARKRGLDGQYENKDGSLEHKKSEPQRIEPAPGTFGYDHSKYRPPREQDEIPMNELGQQHSRNPNMIIAEEDEETGRGQEISLALAEDTRPAYVRPPEQRQAPLSQYDTEPKIPEIRITHSTFDMEQNQAKHDEEHGGCCAKCVIM